MSTRSGEHSGLVDAAAHEARMTIIGTVLFSQRAAHQSGLATTDLWCLSVLYLTGPSTPSMLAEALGLSSGAMTHVIDRLVERGFVTRERDLGDRRRVTVTATGTDGDGPPPLFKSLGEAWRRLLAGYSKAELEVLLDLFSKAHQFTRAEIGGLSDEPTKT